MTRRRRGSRGGKAARATATPLVFALSVAVVLFCAVFVSTSGASTVSAAGRRRQTQTVAAVKAKDDERDTHTLYRINVRLDFDARSYEGTERVRWMNRDDRPASIVYFHLYPNM